MPFPYKDKAAVAALQWAVGLELVPAQPRSLAGGAIHRSPEWRLLPLLSSPIQLLMDRAVRR